MEAARPAQLDDLEAIEQIAARVAEALPDQRGGPLFLRRDSGGEVRGRLEGVLGGNTEGFAVVGTYDDIPFGYALVVIEILEDGGRLARIDDLCVDSEARGSGIGEAIMNLVLELSADAGCFGVDSRALPGDRETKNFFESFGLKARMLVVHKAL